VCARTRGGADTAAASQEGAVNETTVQELRSKLRGELITPADSIYDAARKVYNGMTWARDYWSALHPPSAGGGYVNMMMDEGEDNVKAAYRDNYARLAAIKKVVDPQNLFRVNQNIKPA
jgi:FAD/FMN-containing dehydrogenase